MRPWANNPIQMTRFLDAVLDPRRFIAGTKMTRALHSGAISSLTHTSNRAVLQTLSTCLRAWSPGRHSPPVMEEFYQGSRQRLSVTKGSFFIISSEDHGKQLSTSIRRQKVIEITYFNHLHLSFRGSVPLKGLHPQSSKPVYELSWN